MNITPLRYLLFTLSIMLLCLRQAATAQDIPDYTKVYHPVIHQAELNLLEGNYQNAAHAYKQAFASVPSPFARDYYNAAIASMLLERKRDTFNYLEKLVQKGVSLEYLQRQPVLDSLEDTRRWRRFERKYDKRRRKHEQSVNREYRADLDELYARDQYFREAEGGLRAHRDTIRKIETANTLQLLNWIEELGYPSEDVIGVGDTLEALPRFNVVIERQTLARKGYDFSEVLTKAVQQGKIAPQPAAYLLDQQAGRSRYGSRVYIKINCTGCKKKDDDTFDADEYLVRKISQKEQEKINERRQELGLEPLEEYKRKVLHDAKDPRFKLGYTWSVSNFVVPSDEAAKVLLEGLMRQE